VTIVTDLNQLPPDLPIPEDDGAADHLPGRTAPRLTLPSTSGENIMLVRGQFEVPVFGHQKSPPLGMSSSFPSA
jgi:hypothetical protein